MLNENQPPFPNENIQLEYKAQFTEKIKKEIAAFLNGRQTGYLYLGIDDQTRQIVHHFSKSEQHQIEETISHWLSGTTYYPSPVGLVTVHANETLF
jgi:predicted HTH transcriptional regulator